MENEKDAKERVVEYWRQVNADIVRLCPKRIPLSTKAAVVVKAALTLESARKRILDAYLWVSGYRKRRIKKRIDAEFLKRKDSLKAFWQGGVASRKSPPQTPQ